MSYPQSSHPPNGNGYMIGDIRERLARLEAQSDEARRWIDAHRARTTSMEAQADSRFRSLDARLIDASHHLKLTMERLSHSGERIKALEDRSLFVRRLEVIAPIILIVVAIIYKVPLSDVASLIPK